MPYSLPGVLRRQGAVNTLHEGELNSPVQADDAVASTAEWKNTGLPTPTLDTDSVATTTRLKNFSKGLPTAAQTAALKEKLRQAQVVHGSRAPDVGGRRGKKSRKSRKGRKGRKGRKSRKNKRRTKRR